MNSNMHSHSMYVIFISHNGNKATWWRGDPECVWISVHVPGKKLDVWSQIWITCHSSLESDLVLSWV